MIEAAGEATLQQTLRSSYGQVLPEKEVAEKQKDRQRSVRPVEESQASRESKFEARREEDLTHRNKLEDGRVIVEKYDEDGRLIRKVPPGYVPFGEVA
jgi:hypothetical protein